MNRTHGEPERVKPARCASCGLPYDEQERQRIYKLLPPQETTVVPVPTLWAFCPECNEATCRKLRKLCAEEAERGSQG